MLRGIALFAQMERSCSIQVVKNCIKEIGYMTLVMSSSDKSDLLLKFRDNNSGNEMICGFSIQSQLGRIPLLIKASQATHFVYQVNGLKNDDIQAINAIGEIKKRIDEIYKRANSENPIEFIGVERTTFNHNLCLIDSKFSNLLSEALMLYYRGVAKNIDEISEIIQKTYSLKMPSQFYRFKLKKFLAASVLGMTPGKEWAGKDLLMWEHIIVAKNGDVLTYHIYNRDQFEEYLFQSTRFETPSTKRNHFAKLYKENQKTYLNEFSYLRERCYRTREQSFF